jgi:pimeloyl-ACP methyl ester carboxylesterase
VLIPNTRDGGNHPHVVDFYIPLGTVTRSLVLLHGGSGSKESFAKNLGIATSWNITLATINWSLLDAWNVMAVIPQGQACTGISGDFNPNGANTISNENPEGVRTWSNRQMWSQADDVQFLKDLSTYITDTYGAIGKNLCGHSNGGMMVERMWREAPNNYYHYCSSSAAPSSYYIENSGLPANIYPFFSQIGLLDDTLNVSGGPNGSGSHFYEATWKQGYETYSVADVELPLTWISAWNELQTKVTALGGGTISEGDGVVTDIVSGIQIEWSYVSGQAVLQLIENAGHDIRSHQKCTGRRLFGDWMNFIIAT